MSENKHTPEPWPVFSDIATTLTPDPEGTPVAILSWDDYIRARACVNACARIETSLLEEFPGGINGLSNIAIAKQRDAAIAAERVWESSMMKAVGEDGPGDVVKAIEAIKRQRDELQTKANAMAETINAIAGLCTYQHESKEDFIGRVRAVLGDDPDLRVSSVRKERDDLLEQLKQVEALSEVRLSQRDELLAALELMLERISEPPEANCGCHLSPPCSCHLSPPCADCIDFGGEREAFEEAKSAIARAKGGAA